MSFDRRRVSPSPTHGCGGGDGVPKGTPYMHMYDLFAFHIFVSGLHLTSSK